MLPKKRYLKVGGINAAYVSGGEPKEGKPSVLLLHGWGQGTSGCRVLFDTLCTRYHTVAVDLPGFGHSETPPVMWGYFDYAYFLNQFLDLLSIKSVRLIGHSMGGGVGSIFAAHFPNRVKQLVLANSTGIPLAPLTTLIPMKAIEGVAQLVQSRFDRTNFHYMNMFLFNQLKRPVQTWKSVFVPTCEDTRPFLQKIKAPVTIVWGAKDKWIPVKMARQLKRVIPQAKLHVIDYGYHEWCMIYPREFLELVDR